MKKVQLVYEESTIFIDTDWSSIRIEVFPAEKKFTIFESLNDDVFFNKQTNQYKITKEPVQVFRKLLEKYSEPPKKFSVQDGVVIESKLKDDIFGESTIADLKKEVEWNEIDDYFYELKFFILSQHPELIPYEEYRKFIRQSLERIKKGISKVEEMVSTLDKTGLEIVDEVDNENGVYSQIWYPKNTINSVKKDADYVINTFYEPLFSKTGSEFYAGISKNEFKYNKALIKHLESLLENKITNFTNSADVEKNITKSSNKSLVYLEYGLTILFVGLKLTENIDWSWWIVLSPFLIWEGLGFLHGFIVAFNKKSN